jgi:hypothetical protein
MTCRFDFKKAGKIHIGSLTQSGAGEGGDA